MATNISSIQIRASLQKVWDTITQPEQVKLWQYGSDLVTTWHPGSTIRFCTEWEGTIFEQWGIILTFEPQQALSYTLFAPRPGMEDKPENYFIMKYLLEQENDLVTLQIVQEDNREGAIQEKPQGEENIMLQLLRQLAEAL